jgi:hypothetical protein
MKINEELQPTDLTERLDRFWELSARKLEALERSFDPGQGAPVYTVDGRYTTRTWTEWTQGFQFGSQILQFDATDDRQFLATGRENTLAHMDSHVGDFGVHDHGFNNISTYGNLLRLMREGRTAANEWERRYYELALKLSGAVQLRRWTSLSEDRGYIYSFNGPHSLFVDTIRSCRSPAVAFQLGYELHDERGETVNPLERLVQHLHTTAEHSIYYGQDRDHYDEWGRTVHECIFNVEDGSFRCPSTQQGYSPFSTWTRGLAWAICGFAEQLEFLNTLEEELVTGIDGGTTIADAMRQAARATCDYYIAHTPVDGIPYWDTGAPGLEQMDDHLERPADPFNRYEPVDSSAAAIAAQGLLRFGRYLRGLNNPHEGDRYFQAGLTVFERLLEEPYLSTNSDHQGLLLHSVYHRPNGWDHVPEDQEIPCGESSMWGDYHAREAALYLQRLIENDPYLAFYQAAEPR